MQAPERICEILCLLLIITPQSDLDVLPHVRSERVLAWMTEHVLGRKAEAALEQTSKDLEEDAHSGVVAAKSLMAASEFAPDLWRALPGMLGKPAVIPESLHAGRVC